MGRTANTDTITISKRELKAMLREVMREVVHDELTKLAAKEDWEIEEGSVLWEDLVALKQENHAGRPQLLSHEQIFGK